MRFCKRKLSPMHTIITAEHSEINLNNLYQFQDVQRIFTRTRAYTDRFTTGYHKHFLFSFASVKKAFRFYSLKLERQIMHLTQIMNIFEHEEGGVQFKLLVCPYEKV